MSCCLIVRLLKTLLGPIKRFYTELETSPIVLTQIWTVPPGHSSGFLHERPKHRKKVDILDLINGGVLQAGMTLFPMRKKYNDRIATLLPDGRIEVDALPFAGPTEAATYIAGKANSRLVVLSDGSDIETVASRRSP